AHGFRPTRFAMLAWRVWSRPRSGCTLRQEVPPMSDRKRIDVESFDDESAPTRDPGASPAEGMMVLVAEDQESTRTLLVAMLESLGAKGVIEAEDGRAALEISLELAQPFDLEITYID